MAGVAAVGLVILIDAPFLSQWAARIPFPGAVRVFGASVAAAVFLLCFALLDRRLGMLDERLGGRSTGPSKCNATPW